MGKKHLSGALTLMSLCLLLTQTACLKTRAQIKGNNADDQVEDTDDPKARGAGAKVTRSEVEEIKNEVTRISGKLEEVEHSQRSDNTMELKESVTRLESRVSELEKNQLLVMTELKALKDKGAEAAKEAALPASDLLTQGHQLLKEERYEDAADKFQVALKRGDRGKEGAEAHFGLGEAEYGQKNYKKAIVQYSKVQESSSKSSRIPASLYKIGLSFQHLNMSKEAKGFFAEVIERYPKSPEAKKARGRASKSKEQ